MNVEMKICNSKFQTKISVLLVLCFMLFAVSLASRCRPDKELCLDKAWPVPVQRRESTKPPVASSQKTFVGVTKSETRKETHVPKSPVLSGQRKVSENAKKEQSFGVKQQHQVKQHGQEEYNTEDYRSYDPSPTLNKPWHKPVPSR